MTDHANELRRHARKIPHPQGETPGVMLRAADEIERLQSVIASPHSMTRDDVIRLAREAGDEIEHTLSSDLEFLERFANLVAAAERKSQRHRRAAMTEITLRKRARVDYARALLMRWLMLCSQERNVLGEIENETACHLPRQLHGRLRRSIRGMAHHR